jgi:hypothetical protein
LRRPTSSCSDRWPREVNPSANRGISLVFAAVAAVASVGG